MKFKKIDIGVIIAILSVSVLLLLAIKLAIGSFNSENQGYIAFTNYQGYVAFTEIREDRYIVLVIKDSSKEEIKTHTDSELDSLAQQSAKDYGTKGHYFSLSKSDFNNVKKGQKVEISYKKGAGPDIWGYPIKALSIKIIEK